MHWLAHMVRLALERWGYLAEAAGLLGEDAGLPLPGETVLMFASFIAHKSQALSLWAVILIGIAAAACGDNLGYWAGRKLGPRLFRWLKRKFHMDEDIAVAQDQIQLHGAATVFWARYIFGLRTITGPVAGALDMDWKRFLLYNVLGASTWVTLISVSGYLFADEFNSLAGYFEKASWAVTAVVFTIGYVLWRKKKSNIRNAIATRRRKGARGGMHSLLRCFQAAFCNHGSMTILVTFSFLSRHTSYMRGASSSEMRCEIT